MLGPMLRRAIVIAVVVGAGCGGEDDVVVVVPADALECGTQCSPVAAPGQQGCGGGEKCSALILPMHTASCPGDLSIACVTAGTRMLNESCVWGPAGRNTGFDDCGAGLVCASDGVCRDICGFSGAPLEACAGGLSCFPSSRFEPEGGGDARYGVCAPPL